MSTAVKSQKPERVFRALADSTRLRILYLLLDGELCVCDIVSALQSPQPTISRHLMYLRKVGLVVARKDGIWNYYHLVPVQTELDGAIRQALQACAGLPRFGKDKIQLLKTRAKCCE